MIIAYHNIVTGSTIKCQSFNTIFVGLEFLVLESISIPKVLGPF
ncbi:hypothetical protein L963_818 [Leuconostoc mesenteroides subsp. cremoris T26]|nr:hypothetical protein L963_818 [Leuconostoc mesenteroides subsp. cremoris T26]